MEDFRSYTDVPPYMGHLEAHAPIPIILTVRALDHGGNERDVCNTAIHLDRNRFDVHVATYQAAGIRFEELCAAGVPVVQLPIPSLRKPPQTLMCARLLHRYIHAHGIKLLHAFDNTSIIALPVAKVCGVPVAFSSRLTAMNLFSRKTLRYLNWTDRLATRTIVNCEAVKREIEGTVSQERIALCGSGVDTAEFRPPSPARTFSGGLVIGTVSVLRPEKSLNVLLEAFAGVRRVDPRVRLKIVGSGPELQNLREIAKALNIAEDCTFLPSTRHVSQELRTMDIFVICSSSEALPNSMLEAMACGCCVIASNVGGISEVLRHEQDGLLFQAGNVSELSTQLTSLVAQHERGRDLGRNAAERIRESFDINVTVKRIEYLYSRYLFERAPHHPFRAGEVRER